LNAAYVLTKAAEADLRSIIRYSRNTWGASQARTYIAKIEGHIIGLAQGQQSPRMLIDIHPDLLMLRVEHHYLFAVRRPDAPLLIVAILHERMDLIVRLRDRLG
jgi:toxin ParE1/3/4